MLCGLICYFCLLFFLFLLELSFFSVFLYLVRNLLVHFLIACISIFLNVYTISQHLPQHTQQQSGHTRRWSHSGSVVFETPQEVIDVDAAADTSAFRYALIIAPLYILAFTRKHTHAYTSATWTLWCSKHRRKGCCGRHFCI